MASLIISNEPDNFNPSTSGQEKTGQPSLDEVGNIDCVPCAPKLAGGNERTLSNQVGQVVAGCSRR